MKSEGYGANAETKIRVSKHIANEEGRRRRGNPKRPRFIGPNRIIRQISGFFCLSQCKIHYATPTVLALNPKLNWISMKLDLPKLIAPTAPTAAEGAAAEILCCGSRSFSVRVYPLHGPRGAAPRG